MSKTTPGLTFDTGALIALERRHARIAQIYTTALADGVIVTIPAVVVGEWWRGRTKARETLLRGLRIEVVDVPLAKLAGDAIAAIPGASVVDALVMASAARRGDIVYTSDMGDLNALRAFFPAVRVMPV
jgi:predicted nucleic acid-binding protein